MTATRYSSPDSFRVAVLGAGPAGMSAALWLKQLGFSPIVIEPSTHLGGMQRLNFLRNDWVLGQIGLTGPELCAKFVEHMTAQHILIKTCCSVVSIEPSGQFFLVTLCTENKEIFPIKVRAVVIATGLRYRASEVLETVPGFRELGPFDVAYGPYAFLDMEKLSEKRVLIVGCGDNAFENAHFLLKVGARIVFVCRSFPRTQTRLREAVETFVPRWTLFDHAHIKKFRRENDCIEVSLSSASKLETLQVHKIHVLAGYMPNTDFLAKAFGPLFGCLQFDSLGYLRVDSWGRTGIPGVYAVGDVCNPDFPNVVSAIASGAKAAKAIEIDFRNIS